MESRGFQPGRRQSTRSGVGPLPSTFPPAGWGRPLLSELVGSLRPRGAPPRGPPARGPRPSVIPATAHSLQCVQPCPCCGAQLDPGGNQTCVPPSRGGVKVTGMKGFGQIAKGWATWRVMFTVGGRPGGRRRWAGGCGSFSSGVRPERGTPTLL